MGPQQKFLGRVYRKAIFREYTDSTFTARKPRASEWEHLGMLGPLLRGSVGDTIRVVFRNKADRPYSMHPHGLFYDKDSEEAPYDDGSGAAEKKDDGVAPGETHVYTWADGSPTDVDPTRTRWPPRRCRAWWISRTSITWPTSGNR